MDADQPRAAEPSATPEPSGYPHWNNIDFAGGPSFPIVQPASAAAQPQIHPRPGYRFSPNLDAERPAIAVGPRPSSYMGRTEDTTCTTATAENSDAPSSKGQSHPSERTQPPGTRNELEENASLSRKYDEEVATQSSKHNAQMETAKEVETKTPMHKKCFPIPWSKKTQRRE